MEISALEAMDENVVVASRPPTSPIHDLLRQIQEDEKYHGKLMKLAAFPLPKEKGKAHQQKQNMTNYYGNNASILGFEFVVTRAVDNSAEYLGVTFDPSRIVAGNFERFEEEKKRKAREANERKKARDAEKAKATVPPSDDSDWEGEDEAARLRREAREEIERLEAEEANA